MCCAKIHGSLTIRGQRQHWRYMILVCFHMRPSVWACLELVLSFSCKMSRLFEKRVKRVPLHLQVIIMLLAQWKCKQSALSAAQQISRMLSLSTSLSPSAILSHLTCFYHFLDECSPISEVQSHYLDNSCPISFVCPWLLGPAQLFAWLPYNKKAGESFWREKM